MQTSDFDYVLPDGAIAQAAVEPRDRSSLYVVATDKVIPFADLDRVLQPGDLVVVNSTRVRSARLRTTRRETGGAVEVLLVKRVDDRHWEAMLRPSRRIHAGEQLIVGDRTIDVLTEPDGGVATVVFDRNDGIEAFLDQVGAVPLPPYFSGTLDDDDRYQTIFADRVGSAAAPTAALHFTPELVERLRAMGIRFTNVELEVGLDTFRPMGDGDVVDHTIHTERIIVSADAVEAVDDARGRGGRVIAVGTTVIRTLESVGDGAGGIVTYDGPTDLFITPGYRPTVIDAVITNFHAPRTTLLVLIAAFLGEGWKDVYDHALTEGLRFLSFGDAMYFEVER